METSTNEVMHQDAGSKQRLTVLVGFGRRLR
jgi:hypothetical protein